MIALDAGAFALAPEPVEGAPRPCTRIRRTELESLVLADNELSEVSDQIGCLNGLRMLDLGHNQLTEVPAALGDLEALTDFLCLHDNRLTSLPPCLSRLNRLRYLNISENAFAALPECIFGMDALPDAIGEMLELRQIDLRGNPLRYLPPSLARLPRLEKLDLLLGHHPCITRLGR